MMNQTNSNQIVPRWEWRTFGQDFGEAEEKIKAHKCIRTLESNEIYILSKKSDQNIKIRDLFIDIKVCQEINSDKLERWIPLMKAGFPISTLQLRELCRIANIESRESLASLSFEEFIVNFVYPHPDLTSVGVYKKRYGYLIDGATVELANLEINGTATRTAAVEEVDPDLVLNTVNTLGLSEFENINYIKAMHRMLGFEE
ncbi:hypothetical protein HQ531_06855 [bacterium]|nr:hypothetical protein [bacterium]